VSKTFSFLLSHKLNLDIVRLISERSPALEYFLFFIFTLLTYHRKTLKAGGHEQLYSLLFAEVEMKLLPLIKLQEKNVNKITFIQKRKKSSGRGLHRIFSSRSKKQTKKKEKTANKEA